MYIVGLKIFIGATRVTVTTKFLKKKLQTFLIQEKTQQTFVRNSILWKRTDKWLKSVRT